MKRLRVFGTTKQLRWGISLVAGIAVVVPAQAQKQVAQPFVMPVQVQAAVSMDGCENAPGPQITLDGAVELGGMIVQLTFRNNVKGGNPLIYALFEQGDGAPVGKELLLGRCVQLAPGN